MAKQKKQISIEESLWNTADKLRGSVEPAEYKYVVLGLFFLKYASDVFEQRQKEIIAEGHKEYLDISAFYTMKNVFYLVPEARWSYLMKNAKQNDIALKVDNALHLIEKNNESLKGALPDGYYTRLSLETTKLASLLDEIDKIDTTKDPSHDIIGRVYEYFLQKFAIQEGRGKGEYYTPKCIVNLIAEMIQPFKGRIYDPCCGSGGMFVQSMKFIDNHKGSRKEISVYGQESITATLRLAKMNLAIRGISANLGEKAVSTFTDDQHKNDKFDYIMANPPFNQKDWRGVNELTDDLRWSGYAVPPVGNANYAWVLHMASKLSQNGVAGFLLANGALSSMDIEYQIRRQLILNRLVEAIIILPRDLFYNTDSSVTFWILNRNKKTRAVENIDGIVQYRDRVDEILFMDLRRWGAEYEKKFTQLTPEDIEKASTIFHNWQRKGFEKNYHNVPELCYSAFIDEIEKKNYSLVPSKYIQFVDRDSDIDFDKEMERIQAEFAEILREETESQKEIKNAFKGLGYELKA